MSNAPQNQNQNQKAQNVPAANQANTAKVGNNIKKDEPTAGKDSVSMKGGACSTDKSAGDKASSCSTTKSA